MTRELTRNDRCCASATGACAAEVLVQLHEDNEPLLFCKHHWAKAKEPIMALDPFFVLDVGAQDD